MVQDKEFNLSEEEEFCIECGDNYKPAKVREFIKIVEGIILNNESPRSKLDELRQRAGNKLT